LQEVFPEVEKYDKEHSKERFDNEGRQLRRIRIGGYTVLAGFIVFVLFNVTLWKVSKYRRQQRLAKLHRETSLKYEMPSSDVEMSQ
jgi:cytoskeletal protein RodZ